MHELLRTLIELTLASSAAAALALLIRRPVRRAFGAPVAYVVWLCVPIAVIATLLPGGVMNTPALHVPVSLDALLPRDLAITPSPGEVTRGAIGPHSAVDWTACAAAAWAVGALAFVAYLIGLQRAYLRSLGPLFEQGGTLRAEQPAGCPALVGVFRPRVILPADFETRYTQAEQSLVLAHERVHLYRADAMWNALAALVRCVFWFNPLMHYAASRFRVDQELSCDAAVMQRHPDARRVYADAMLKTQLAGGLLPAGCHWRSAHPLKERLTMLKQPAPRGARRVAGGVFVAVLLTGIGYAAWAAEPAMPPAPPVLAAPSTPTPAPPMPPGPDAVPSVPQPTQLSLAAADAQPAQPPQPPQPTQQVQAIQPVQPPQPAQPSSPVESPDLRPPQALPAEPSPPAEPALPVAPAEPAAPADPAVPAAPLDDPKITVTASRVDSNNAAGKVEMWNVTIAWAQSPYETSITADHGVHTPEGDWLFDGHVVAHHDGQAVKAEQVKFTRDGKLVATSPANITRPDGDAPIAR